MSDRLHVFVLWHASVLSASWLLATAAALYAYTVAPLTIADSPVQTVAALQSAWPWYMLCYGLFAVTDAAIALLGASLLAWLAPLGSARALAMAVLFALAGALGLVMDTGMLVAAQVGPISQDAAPDSRKPLARRAGASPRWIRFTRVLAGWQMLVSTLIVWAAISAAPATGMLSLAAGVIAMPILASLWLAGLVREVRRTRGLAVTAWGGRQFTGWSGAATGVGAFSVCGRASRRWRSQMAARRHSGGGAKCAAKWRLISWGLQ